MLKKLIATVTAALALALVGAPTPAVAGGGGGNDVRVEARFAGPGLTSGKAVYRERFRDNTLQQRFKVEVEDAAAGEEFAVSVNNLFIATIFADDLGRAEIQFRTAAFIDDPGDGQPIDTDFPMLAPGDTITVGKMSGVFQED
ncbi:MAG: hypothetical protein RLN60_01530 [Phycisphaerales bacterium]